MASNNDLDDFFKKKDRKSNKSKKQTTNSMLTNNEELLKQLVIVTSATQAFKENMVSDDEDDELQGATNNDAVVVTGYTEDTHKHSKTKVHDKTKPSSEPQTNFSAKPDGQQQQEQDVWEDYEEANSKFREFRLKLTGGKEGEGYDNDYDDENDPDNNDNNNDAAGERGQQKDRPVWKINSIQEERQQEPVVEQKTEQPKPAPATASVYRPPQLRSGTSVAVVGSVNSRVTKKEKPNLASTDEFPTLGATVNKK